MTSGHLITPRVLSLPEDHAYVTQALPADSVVSAPVSPRQARGWDIHPAFTSGWLDEHRASYDLVHLHFGFDSLSLSDLGRWLADLDRLDLPLVLTVHDLRNPHHDTATLHDAQLRLLLPAAAQLITLTDGAAAEILRRCGRRAQVIAHPRVLTAPVQRVAKAAVVGIAVKTRAQVVAPDRVVAAVLRGAIGAGARLRVDAHPDSLARLQQTQLAAADGQLDLHVRERFSDGEFAAYLAGVDVAVLPYRFGTHSGWLEACRDAGTRVVAPDCGYYVDQWDEVISYSHGEVRGLDEDSLTVAVQAALSAPRLGPADVAERSQTGHDSVERHRQLWRDALERGTTSRAA